MQTFVSREFKFDAAHKVVDYNGKCENLHGHTYFLKVTIRGELKNSGMVLDFAILKKEVNKIVDQLDHKYLNDLFENPTTEHVAIFIFEKLKKAFEKYQCDLYEVQLSEGPNNTVIIKE